MEFVSKNKEETKTVAEELLKFVANRSFLGAGVVALRGDLGAGKTTFTQEAAKLLGVRENVISPTFIIEKIYKLENRAFDHFIHIDAYRLDDPSELERLGWANIVSDKRNLIFIEWPERVANILPKDAVPVQLEFVDEATRKITF